MQNDFCESVTNINLEEISQPVPAHASHYNSYKINHKMVPLAASDILVFRLGMHIYPIHNQFLLSFQKYLP